MFIRAVGRLCVSEVLDGHADRVVFEDRNLVVDIGMQVFSRMLGGNVGTPSINGSTFSSISDLAVTKMLLGKSGSPPTPTHGDTIGVYDVFYQPALTITYPTDTSIRFTGIIPSTESNGTVVTEEALYLANGLLFAKRIIVPGIVKPVGNALKFDHTFDFSRG